METPKYFYNGSCLWDAWIATGPGRLEPHINIGETGITTVHSKKRIDGAYPGFSTAFEMLTAAGCDQYFVTCMLKFSIINANTEGLDTFLLRTNTLRAVENAVLLGLTSDELIEALQNGVPAQSVALPDSLSSVSLD